MGVATTTMPDFLVAAESAFADRFDGIVVCLPDGYAKKVESGYEGAMIVLSVEFAAADPDQQQGHFDTPARVTLRVQVYTATGFGDWDGRPDAYQAGLALVSDIIGWGQCRRFIEGQWGLEFLEMEAGDYDVKTSFQIPWIVEFAAPMRFDDDREVDEDPFLQYGDYTGLFPPQSASERSGSADEIPDLEPDMFMDRVIDPHEFYTPGIVGALSVEMTDAVDDTTLTLAEDATREVNVGDLLQVESEYVRVTALDDGAPQQTFTVARGQMGSAVASHAVGQDVSRLPLLPDQFYTLGIVGALSAAMTNAEDSTTLTLAALRPDDATLTVGKDDVLQVENEFVRVTEVVGPRSYTVLRARFSSERVAHAVGTDVSLLPRDLR